MSALSLELGSHCGQTGEFPGEEQAVGPSLCASQVSTGTLFQQQNQW